MSLRTVTWKKWISIAMAMLCFTFPVYAQPAKTTPNSTTTKTTTVKTKHKTKALHKKKHKKSHKKNTTHHHKKKVISKPVDEDDSEDNSEMSEAAKEAPKEALKETPREAPSQPVVAESKSWFMSSFQHHLVDYVYQTVDHLRHNSYKLGGTRFDSAHGVYRLDCSSYVDHLLQQASPNAYFSLVDSMGTDKPTTQHYYDFFTDLADSSHNYWNKVDEVDELRPGDILVFRYKNSRGYQTGGHVVVVMDKPIRDTDVVFLRVADSARSRHSHDTRQRHESGIGIGTMLLKINPKTGQPAAFAWGLGSYWNKNVTFAMARPLGYT